MLCTNCTKAHSLFSKTEPIKLFLILILMCMCLCVCMRARVCILYACVGWLGRCVCGGGGSHLGTMESPPLRVVGSSSKSEAMSLPWGTATSLYLILSPRLRLVLRLLSTCREGQTRSPGSHDKESALSSPSKHCHHQHYNPSLQTRY